MTLASTRSRLPQLQADHDLKTTIRQKGGFSGALAARTDSPTGRCLTGRDRELFAQDPNVSHCLSERLELMQADLSVLISS